VFISSAATNFKRTTIMNPVTLEHIKDQSQWVAARLGKFFHGFEQDIEQEAWVACLEAAKHHDPTKPGAKGHFYRCALLQVTPRANRWMAVTSLSKVASRAGNVGSRQRNMTVDVKPGSIRLKSYRAFGRSSSIGAGAEQAEEFDVFPPVPFAEESLESVVLLAQREVTRLRAKRRRIIDRLTRNDTEVCDIGCLLLGIDRAPVSVVAAAKRLGVDLDDAKKLSARWRKLLKGDPRVAELTQHIEDIEENLP
jgi:hypothetical protein